MHFDADLHRLAELRGFVRAQAAAADAPADCVDDLVQAVDEAATNVIRHGYRGADGWLDVDMSADGYRFVVIIEDGAPAFDPTTVPEPDLTIPPMARKPCGRGVHLIRLAVDFSRLPTASRRWQHTDAGPVHRARTFEGGPDDAHHVGRNGCRACPDHDRCSFGRSWISTNFERFVDEVQALYQNGTRALILDLTDLTFLASSGLVALHSIVRIMHGQAPIDPEFFRLGRVPHPRQ